MTSRLACALWFACAAAQAANESPSNEAPANQPSANEPLVAPFSASVNGALPPPWMLVTLPKIPRHTRYTIVTLDGAAVVKAEADGSYANLVHPLGAAVDDRPLLQWRWRVDRVPAASNLAVKEGDDLAAKVCVLFDVPLERLAFGDRVKIELGRLLFRQDLPAAAVCYVWDRAMPAGTWLANVYTDRVQMLVLRSAGSGEIGRWFSERRDLRADFERAFPREARGGLPAVSAIAIATDADNTGGAALAWFGNIELARE